MAIKSTCEDFIVEEILTESCRASIRPNRAPFAVYLLEKRNLTTPEAIGLLARRLNVPENHIAAAGLKDKLAHTLQHVTLPIAPMGSSDARLPESIAERDWSAKRIGFTSTPMTASVIERNRFTLVVRTLTRKAIDDMDAVAHRLRTAPDRLLVVNYFGNQRFGSSRAGKGFLASLLVRGEFENAMRIALAIPHRKDLHKIKMFKRTVAEGWGRWKSMLPKLPRVPLRKPIEHLAHQPGDFRGAFTTMPYFDQCMWVEAYQSWLWNRIATRLLLDSCVTDADIIEDQYNKLIFPAPSQVPPPLRRLELPLLGLNTKPIDPWRGAAQAVLDEENIATADLHIGGLKKPYFSEISRTLFIEAARCVFDEPQPDETQPKAKRYKRTIKFELPRGSYATVVMRALGQ